MKTLLSALAIGVCLSFGTAHAANKAPNAQQNRMAACNQEAGDKKGDDRKAFMKTCLSAKRASSQERMKACNADTKAKTLKGNDRKAFMKECLSNKPA